MRKRTSCFSCRLRHPAAGPMVQATRGRRETCLFARQSIAAAREFETWGYAAGTVGFLARGLRGRALVRAAPPGLQRARGGAARTGRNAAVRPAIAAHVEHEYVEQRAIRYLAIDAPGLGRR